VKQYNAKQNGQPGIGKPFYSLNIDFPYIFLFNSAKDFPFKESINFGEETMPDLTELPYHTLFFLAHLPPPDGRTEVLNLAASASEVRFVEGKSEWWEHQGETTYSVNDELMFTGRLQRQPDH